MKLSVIIPVYNEEKTIKEIIDKVKKVDLNKEIIIVDDGSTDHTKEILRKIENNKIKVIRHIRNKGKGAAVRTGIRHATGDLILIQDADLEYNPENYNKLIRPITEKNAKVVYGYRKIKKQLRMYPLYYIGNISLTLFTNILYNSKIKDMETCYKVFKANILKSINLKSDGFDFEPEITAKILKRGIRITQVPIDFYPRAFEEGKKIKWKDGIKAFLILLKYRLLD